MNLLSAAGAAAVPRVPGIAGRNSSPGQWWMSLSWDILSWEVDLLETSFGLSCPLPPYGFGSVVILPRESEEREGVRRERALLWVLRGRMHLCVSGRGPRAWMRVTKETVLLAGVFESMQRFPFGGHLEMQLFWGRGMHWESPPKPRSAYGTRWVRETLGKG